MSQLNDPAAAVGLYSISVREPDVATLLSWAARSAIPFLHLRGGHRGYDLATQDRLTLRRWRAASSATVPITGVTADTDLVELLSAQPAVRRRADEDVRRLADAAHTLGARWLRLLARHPLDIDADTLDLPRTAVPLLVELHDPRWLHAEPHAALMRLLGQQPRLGLLADTAQLTLALARGNAAADDRAGDRLQQLAPWVEVLHLSDTGDGLTDPGHALVADHLTRPGPGAQRTAPEVAVEWTGPDRSPATALARHREHAAWWVARRQPSHPGAAS